MKSDRFLFALIWEFYSHIRVDNVDKPETNLWTGLWKAYRSKSSYTAQYRTFLFRHRIGGKIVYRCSGTFCQFTRLNFGYFVYWFFLLTCSAFSTKKRPQPLRPGPIFYILRIDKILAVQLTVCLFKSRLRTPWYIAIGVQNLVSGLAFFFGAPPWQSLHWCNFSSFPPYFFSLPLFPRQLR